MCIYIYIYIYIERERSRERERESAAPSALGLRGTGWDEKTLGRLFSSCDSENCEKQNATRP